MIINNKSSRNQIKSPQARRASHKVKSYKVYKAGNDVKFVYLPMLYNILTSPAVNARL